jgi:8-oxo-dGTP pyrophosphatase MutT (NUDIX family)
MNKKAKVLVGSYNFVDEARELYNKYAEEAGQPAFDYYKIVRHDPILIRVAEEWLKEHEWLCTHPCSNPQIVEIPGTKYLIERKYHLGRYDSPGGWTTEVLTPETMEWVSVEEKGVTMNEPVAAAVIVLLDSKILAFRRKKDGQIGLPCGMMEEGESIEETAIRECFEETGYEVKILSDQEPFIGFDPKGEKVVACFVGHIVSEGEPTHSHEGDVIWVDPAELLDSGYGDYNKRALEHFSIKKVYHRGFYFWARESWRSTKPHLNVDIEPNTIISETSPSVEVGQPTLPERPKEPESSCKSCEDRDIWPSRNTLAYWDRLKEERRREEEIYSSIYADEKSEPEWGEGEEYDGLSYEDFE